MDFTLVDGVIVMVTSLVIVFLALVILQFVIEVMHRFIQRKEMEKSITFLLKNFQNKRI
ncbi:OadG family protein [Carnobacterium sp.]|uniref:OadG family protein n=1 Tax=Carnobacterium sp. TaxID=48221 RepID=UPI0028AC1508|nr:OadG family protein [Carnobacterium sp.]